ncbi:MAG TPA: Flp pilus assembly protein CpaB [Tepidisphaeraceae bacterium]|jgi:pilus assembly protein CpaB
MNWKAFTPLAVAVVLGLLAARVGMSLVNNSGPAVAEPTNLVSVLVAARDIEPGTTLSETDFATAKTPADSIPSGAFTSADQATGKVIRISLVRGQTLTPNLLADDGAGYGVGATLPPGMRAVTIDIVETTGVAGFILPKCKVDVLATLLVDGRSISRTVLESVTVLAVGMRTNPNAPVDPTQPPSKTVTLLVKPKDAERVELAATMSRIRLALRNGRDESVADSEGITLAELKGRDSDPFSSPLLVAATQPATTQPVSIIPVVATTPAPKPAPKKWSVQIIKAGKVSTEQFTLPDAGNNVPAVETDEDETMVNIDPFN